MLSNAIPVHATFKRKLIPSCLATATALTLAPALTHASSFYLLEQSPAHLGHAFAGTASNINDASTVFFNPAGIGLLNDRQLTVGASVIRPRSSFSDRGSNTGSLGATTRETEIIPNVYYIQPFDERIAFGVGLSVPFGLSSDYGDQWAGRYLATSSELELLNFHANVSYIVNEQLSVGVGINYQRLDVTLKNAVDSTLGDDPQPETDSHASITGDDDDIVFDLSAHFQFTEDTAFGFSWRQGGTFSLRGDASFSLNPACITGNGADPNTAAQCAEFLNTLEGPVRADVTMPDTITVSATHIWNEAWTLHADIAWTQWSNIQFVDVVNIQNDSLVDTLDLEYSDTFRFAFGATYHMEGPLTWRVGIARDHAPQTNPVHMTPRIPDEDRTWFSVGLNYMHTEELTFDVGYAHILVSSADIADDNPQTGHSVRGNFSSHVNILAAQVNWSF